MYAPPNNHIDIILFPPVYTIHRNPVQWKVGTIKGDASNPLHVKGTQK